MENIPANAEQEFCCCFDVEPDVVLHVHRHLLLAVGALIFYGQASATMKRKATSGFRSAPIVESSSLLKSIPGVQNDVISSTYADGITPFHSATCESTRHGGKNKAKTVCRNLQDLVPFLSG